MLNNRNERAATRMPMGTAAFGGHSVSGTVAASGGTGMSTFVAVAGIADRKPAALDARVGAQGASPAWSPPV